MSQTCPTDRFAPATDEELDALDDLASRDDVLDLFSVMVSASFVRVLDDAPTSDPDTLRPYATAMRALHRSFGLFVPPDQDHVGLNVPPELRTAIAANRAMMNVERTLFLKTMDSLQNATPINLKLRIGFAHAALLRMLATLCSCDRCITHLAVLRGDEPSSPINPADLS